MNSQIKKNWKNYLIIFLSIAVVFLLWRGIGCAGANIKLGKELQWVYRQLLEERIAAPTEEECMNLYGAILGDGIEPEACIIEVIE